MLPPPVHVAATTYALPFGRLVSTTVSSAAAGPPLRSTIVRVAGNGSSRLDGSRGGVATSAIVSRRR